MKNFMIKAAVVSLPLIFGNAMADDAQKSQNLMDGLVPMNASELATVTGTWGYWGRSKTCIFCSNAAGVTQLNISGLSAFVAQANGSGVSQSNN